MKSEKDRPVVRETPLTYDDYAALPYEEGKRYELAGGKLELMSPAPSPRHQVVSNQLAFIMNQSCGSDYWIFTAPIDVILSRIEVRQPDLVMVHRSRTSIITRRGIEGPPDLVVEMMSTYSRRRDKVQKTKAYAQYSVPEYWIVDLTSQTLEQYVLIENHYELVEVYMEDEPVRSENITCASFSINDLFKHVSDLPE